MQMLKKEARETRAIKDEIEDGKREEERRISKKRSREPWDQESKRAKARRVETPQEATGPEPFVSMWNTLQLVMPPPGPSAAGGVSQVPEHHQGSHNGHQRYHLRRS